MDKIVVFIIRRGGLKGLEGDSAHRIMRYLLRGDDGVFDVFEISNTSEIGKTISHNKAYKFIVLIYGDLYITHESIIRLSRIMERHALLSVIVPVSNETAISHQRYSPPFLYKTLSVFRWAVDEVYERYGDEVVEVNEIDDFCIAIKRDVFDRFQDDIQSIHISKAVKDRGGRLAVAKGIYVHRYGNCYESARDDLLRYVPSDAIDILDIGCANGLFGEMLKKRQRCTVTGIDTNIGALDTAKSRLDFVIHGDIEEIINKGVLRDYDCIVCGDVLEHLNDPWKVVGVLKRHLKDGGLFIASVPNISNWAILYEMLQGRWDYVPFTILSGTHIRFFTKDTLKELFEENGYVIKEILFHGLEIPDNAKEFLLSLKRLLPYVNEDELKASEILIVAQKA